MDEPPHRVADAYEGAGESSGYPNASPPLSTAFQRHHQPTHTPTGEDIDPFSRRRPVNSGAGPSSRTIPTRRDIQGELNDENSVWLCIATPYNDIEGSQGRRASRVARDRLIAQIKDDIASGNWDGSVWERDKMRLVWQGRIVRDEESIGSVVGKPRDPSQHHTLHLVGRRRPGLSRRPTPLPIPEPSQEPQTSGPSSPIQRSTPQNRHSRALEDTVHFLLFLARRHLCLFLGRDPINWEDMIPPPVVEETMARSAIISVVRAIAFEQGENVWVECQKAFEEDQEATWKSLGRRGLEEELKLMWKANLGREWLEGPIGETVFVEFDGATRELNLPPMAAMSPQQLCHLLQYLRITALLPCLNHLLEQSSIPPPPVPTPTIRIQVPTESQGEREILRLHIRFHMPSISLSLLSHAAFSAIKISAMLYMMCASMKRTDMRLWIIVGAAVGWWIADVWYELRQEQARRPRPPLAQPQAGVDGAQQAQPNAPADPGAPPNVRAQADAPRNWQAVPGRVRQQRDQTPLSVISQSIPLLHLNTDAEQLHLNGQPYRTPLARPWRIVTQLLLPIALWFITLIPEWEAIRARAIRRRERSMRVLVGEMSAAPSPVQETIPLPEEETEDLSEEAQGSEEHTQAENIDQPTTESRPTIRVYPIGLNAVAKRYYERVMERGEGIDWEEEREAQRAMGIGEEEEREGGGMRMGML
ncbi:hypothetical protein BD324DRAFT_638558 [Kockovaella imperatae]|uniref:Ubiquitin-like domain-containing protein n=1 Tax=Kockovaella imperatae TaxID=4999 RepID=A0A1Y1U6W1_9TREE|nr:hypothetical protein BD324DRAFT_638558 [Kockovaella imperatae]ORX33783.1 hypothetical protein BD324DRAFT_638558 [Kockovaella imperatae]